MEDPLGQLVIQRYLSDYHFILWKQKKNNIWLNHICKLSNQSFPRVELAKFVVLYTRKYDIISCHIMSLKQRHGTGFGL